MQFTFRHALLAAILAPVIEAKLNFCRNALYIDCHDPFDIVPGSCRDLAADWDNQCSSSWAEAGNECYMWKSAGCKGTAYGPVRNDDTYSDFSKFGIDNKISSWMCLTA